MADAGPDPTVAPDMSPAVRAKLDEVAARYDALTAELERPEVAADYEKARDLAIRRAAIERAAEAHRAMLAAEAEAGDLREATSSGDAELAAMAREELPRVEEAIAAHAQAAIEALVTADDQSIASVMLEIRAGTGGDEAALWAGDLLEMYRALALARGWRIDELDLSTGAIGGVRSATINVQGQGVFTDLAHEAGTHCVKRVPATETQGRVHTSTATVAVLPEPEEVDLKIDPADVEEHVTTAQGPGGQNVNKVATAVHLVHRPTGVEVRMQESKSQRQNREKAWRLLRARLYESERERQAAARNEARSAQIGAGGRSERIRTYRYKENAAVDHRLGEQFNLQETLAGNLDPLLAGLRRLEIERRLAAL